VASTSGKALRLGFRVTETPPEELDDDDELEDEELLELDDEELLELVLEVVSVMEPPHADSTAQNRRLSERFVLAGSTGK